MVGGDIGLKVIIAGTRTFGDYTQVERIMQGLPRPSEIVCGGAKGADTLGELWAKRNNIKVRYFFPDWDKYGKAAGPCRNARMAEYGDYLVAFWDGKSKGTKNMIEEMKKRNKHGKVIVYV